MFVLRFVTHLMLLSVSSAAAAQGHSGLEMLISLYFENYNQLKVISNGRR